MDVSTLRQLPESSYVSPNKQRSDFEKIQNTASAAELNYLTPKTDVFQKTQETSPVTEETSAVKPEKMQISYKFDLFYELSQEVSMEMGQNGKERFVNLAASVSEKFQSNFSLSIDPVGSFMNGTKESLKISPETTNSFFDAVENLSEMSPESLENFFKESDKFFEELKKTYGDAGGSFDEIKQTMQDQAKKFFDAVSAIKQDAAGQLEAPEGEAQAALPESTENEQNNALQMQNGQMVSQSDYQDFLKNFSEYARKFRENMVKNFISSIIPRETSNKKEIEAPENSEGQNPESDAVKNEMIKRANANQGQGPVNPYAISFKSESYSVSMMSARLNISA
ncbi:MAG: hypothetical protein HQM10_02665 [Candidatus Riflebacteria bacterium]|nr:hypothetical protein [Candidatus Riflebacteria bacterium]